MAQGLSVHECMLLEGFLREKIQGLTDSHVQAVVSLVDGLKGHKFKKPVDVKGVLVYDTMQETDDNDVDLMYAEVNGAEALELILEVHGDLG